MKPNSAWVWSANGLVPKLLRDNVDHRTLLHPVEPQAWPGTDIYATPFNINAATERLAGRLGATVVILPEAADWLNDALAESERPLRVFVARRQGDEP